MSGPAEPVKRKRVYEQWKGNEQFFCWGYLVAGPNWRASIGTAFLLLAPTGIFLGFVAPYVAARTHMVILAFSIILPTLCTLFLFLTACRDPGIIPRREPDEDYLANRKPRTKEVIVNGQKIMIRYNDTCHFYQPPRAHHCSVNDNCIQRFDHHCPWVGTTIGKRNYRTFLLFVYSATILCMYVIGVCLAQLFLRHQEYTDSGGYSDTWGTTFANVVPAVVIMVYCFVFMWFVGGLSFFHAYLVGTNQTTYENFRYNHDTRPNPFDRGLFSNCAEVWCTRTPPSQINFRAYVDDPNAVTRPDQVNIDMPGTTPRVQQPFENRRALAPSWIDAPQPPHNASSRRHVLENESPQTTLPLPPTAAVADATREQQALAALAASSPYAVPHANGQPVPAPVQAN